MNKTFTNRDFLIDALKEKLRLDSRDFNESRQWKLIVQKDLGSFQCHLGDTKVFTKVSCEPVQPHPDRPTEGFVQIFCEFNQMAHEDFDHYSKSTDDEILLNRMLEKTIRGSRAIDTEGLCIISGKLVWLIRLDVHVLNHDGNLMDCASISSIASLLHFRRPEVTVTDEKHPVTLRHPVPLSIHHLPFSSTFSIFENGSIILSDPTYIEESFQEGSIVISTNAQHEICAISKAGGVGLTIDQIYECCEKSYLRSQSLSEQVQNIVAEDLMKRDMHKKSIKGKMK